MVLTVIISVAIYAPQVCALEPAFILDNLAKSYEGTFTWHDPNSTVDFLLIWLISIPIISLVALYRKKRSVAIRNFLALSVLYNFIAVVILLQHAVTTSVTGTDPLAFVIEGPSYSYFAMAVIAGINSKIIRKKIRHYYTQ